MVFHVAKPVVEGSDISFYMSMVATNGNTTSCKPAQLVQSAIPRRGRKYAAGFIARLQITRLQGANITRAGMVIIF